MKQVIFDTDIGIDDAMALLFLHAAPQVELRAIVTGFGNADIDNTTRNALYVCERFGINAPVYRGAASPTGPRLGSGYPDFVHGSNGLGDIQFDSPSRAEEDVAGAQAIVDIVSASPNEISIVSVGRMTNLAQALDLCPELPALVREAVIMGGAFGFNGHSGNVSPVAEANIAGDPMAADRVMTSGLPITVVGLDVTQESVLDEAFFKLLRDEAGPLGEFVYDISRRYLAFHEEITGKWQCPVHDSSAVACLLSPGLFTMAKGAVRVATTGIAIGQTIFAPSGSEYESPDWSGGAELRICTAVDAQRLIELYRETLVQAGN